jgi:hypothetical protein
MLPSWIRSRNCRPAVRVLLRDGDHESEVRLDEFLLRLLGLRLAAVDGLERVPQVLGAVLEALGHAADLGPQVLLLLQQRLAVLFLHRLDALGRLRVELPGGVVELALDLLDGLDRVLHLLDHLALDGLGELDLADVLRQLHLRAHQLPLRAAVLLLVLLQDGVELLAELLGGLARLAHRLDLLEELLRALLDAVVGDLLVVEDHELADGAVAGLQVVAHPDDRAHDRGHAGDGLDDRQLAALDAPCDFDLALARQQGHGAHLAEVHADRVVRLVERPRGEVEFGLFGPVAVDGLAPGVPLLGVHEVDARVAKDGEELFEVFGRRGDLRRQDVVHLVVQEVALLLADDDELPDFLVPVFDRQGCHLLSRINAGAWPSAKPFIIARSTGPQRVDSLHQRALPLPERLEGQTLGRALILQTCDFPLYIGLFAFVAEEFQSPDALLGVPDRGMLLGRDGGQHLRLCRT